MNHPQREALRHKRAIIADLMEFTASAKEIKELDLLNDDMLSDIKQEKDEYSQIFKWLELLPMCGDGAFDKLIKLLTAKELKWVASELQADLACEKGELHIEEYVYREAGILVHKNFGRKSKVPELDKKEIQRLLAERYQTAKDAYANQVKEVEKRLDESLKAKVAEEEKIEDLMKKIHAYLRVEHDRLDKHAHHIEETLDAIACDPESQKPSEKDQVDILDDTIEGILDVLSRELYEKEVHMTERRECTNILMKELGAEAEKPVFHLDSMLEEIINRNQEQMAQAKEEADLANNFAQSMEEKFNNLKSDTDRLLSSKEEQILRLEAEILTKSGENTDLQKKQMYLHEDIEHLKHENVKWIKRCDQLEKTRRMGYYQGHYERTNGKIIGSRINSGLKPDSHWRTIDFEATMRNNLESINSMALIEDDLDESISLVELKDGQMGTGAVAPLALTNGEKGGGTPPPITKSRYMTAVTKSPAKGKKKQTNNTTKTTKLP